jgi:hypothetical protein
MRSGDIRRDWQISSPKKRGLVFQRRYDIDRFNLGRSIEFRNCLALGTLQQFGSY